MTFEKLKVVQREFPEYFIAKYTKNLVKRGVKSIRNSFFSNLGQIQLL